jgi:hypothetical protein
MLKMRLLLIACFFLSCQLFAQDDLLNMLEDEAAAEATPENVSATFKGIKLINANTIETTKKKTLEFRITHRFGNMQLGKAAGVHSLGGLDNASNIRFSLDYGLTDNISIGLGRSKTLEHIDGNLKWRFLSQKTSGMPISAAYFTNFAVTPMAANDDRYDNLGNRFSYTHQLIIARKFSPSISLEILPTFVHRNLVDQTIFNPSNNAVDENDILAMGFAGRVKVSKRVALVADYFLTFSEFRTSENGYYDPVSVGIEIETGGHVFHLNVSNSAGIIENDFISNTTDSWGDGNYKLGFNISRVFNF